METNTRWRVALLAAPALIALASLFVLPPISQDPNYHRFFDHRTIFGVPNFWNVISNLPLLFVALWGVRVRPKPRGFGVLLVGTALIALGSAWYHLSPNDHTLLWDRLPMTIAFMSVLAITIGERISARAGRLLLWPLLLVGAGSVLWWRYSGDLRFYAIVQFYPMLALPLILITFPAPRAEVGGTWLIIGWYAVAKVFEIFDTQIGSIIATGGHPWKHVAAAVALFCYISGVSRCHPALQDARENHQRAAVEQQ